MESRRKRPRSGPPHVACIVESSMAFGREICGASPAMQGTVAPLTTGHLLSGACTAPVRRRTWIRGLAAGTGGRHAVRR